MFTLRSIAGGCRAGPAYQAQSRLHFAKLEKDRTVLGVLTPIHAKALLVNSPNVRPKSCNIISHSYQFEIDRRKSQDFLREASKGFNKQRFSRKNDLHLK
jgi:hypothetical protein